METEALPFGPGALVVVGFYVLTLLAIGGLAYTKRKDESLGDFFLAGRSMGFVVLILTLYATQYSGNTFFGFSGAAYREGLGFLFSIHFMTAIVVAYLLFAPKLYRLSQEKRFITPGDFIYHRFQSRALCILVTLLMVYALCNFTLAQMKTLGTAFEGISQGRIPLWVGVVGLAGVMLIYESLGGMRSVAWTDAVQGGILLLGFGILLYLAVTEIGTLPSAVATLASNPETVHKIRSPDSEGVRRWISFILMVGLGAAIYPQAIQRIYAARNVNVLKRSLAVMAFLPLTTTMIAVLVGVLMAAHVPDLKVLVQGAGSTAVPSETVFTLLCLEVMQGSEFGYWLVVLLFAALLAAVMSTADSALLSISSMITQDIYGRFISPEANQARLTHVGRWVTWALMIPIVWIAITYEGNLIELLKLKFELLIQCVPVIYLGIHCRWLTARTVILGILVGLAVTLGLTWSGSLGLSETNHPMVWGFHSGVIGLLVNGLVCFSDYFRSSRNLPA
ncbi:MAG: sodium:proline symporter [Nitrospinaceae bacterium]|nr:MAG: sodium:proline symporter [Nitrospinaceae bacterium]